MDGTDSAWRNDIVLPAHVGGEGECALEQLLDCGGTVVHLWLLREKAPRGVEPREALGWHWPGLLRHFGHGKQDWAAPTNYPRQLCLHFSSPFQFHPQAPCHLVGRKSCHHLRDAKVVCWNPLWGIEEESRPAAVCTRLHSMRPITRKVPHIPGLQFVVGNLPFRVHHRGEAGPRKNLRPLCRIWVPMQLSDVAWAALKESEVHLCIPQGVGFRISIAPKKRKLPTTLRNVRDALGECNAEVSGSLRWFGVVYIAPVSGVF
mmetsp:Transcript_23729/g.65858  ORF Transcript_23729/g.65858 Transcript_23729/m.65858 type:complete len:261 (+) Transcript_23729:379-1161(+)